MSRKTSALMTIFFGVLYLAGIDDEEAQSV